MKEEKPWTALQSNICGNSHFFYDMKRHTKTIKRHEKPLNDMKRHEKPLNDMKRHEKPLKDNSVGE